MVEPFVWLSILFLHTSKRWSPNIRHENRATMFCSWVVLTCGFLDHLTMYSKENHLDIFSVGERT